MRHDLLDLLSTDTAHPSRGVLYSIAANEDGALLRQPDLESPPGKRSKTTQGRPTRSLSFEPSSLGSSHDSSSSNGEPTLPYSNLGAVPAPLRVDRRSQGRRLRSGRQASAVPYRYVSKAGPTPRRRSTMVCFATGHVIALRFPGIKVDRIFRSGALTNLQKPKPTETPMRRRKPAPRFQWDGQQRRPGHTPKSPR